MPFKFYAFSFYVSEHRQWCCQFVLSLSISLSLSLSISLSFRECQFLSVYILPIRFANECLSKRKKKEKLSLHHTSSHARKIKDHWKLESAFSSLHFYRLSHRVRTVCCNSKAYWKLFVLKKPFCKSCFSILLILFWWRKEFLIGDHETLSQSFLSFSLCFNRTLKINICKFL
jgi:hypothetical protein